MKRSSAELEKLIHETLRASLSHRAPHTLEARVLDAIAARAARPWWQRSFAQWPASARVAFVLASVGLAKLALMIAVWVMAGFSDAQFAHAFSTQVGWFQTASAVASSLGDFLGAVYRDIPPLWLYGGFALLVALYVALFGLGAAAYRTLYANR